jgi:MSHA pilin protein MshD
MGTSQSVLSIGAMTLLTFLILRFNGIQITAAEAAYNAKFGIVANSLANSIIEEAKDKIFDEVVLDSTVVIHSASDFSTVLGNETGEVYPAFDDFDDFDNLYIVDSLSLIDPQSGKSTKFEIRSTVDYVTDTNPNSISVNKTYHKRLAVAIFSDAMIDTVKLSTVFSFWTLLE